MCLLVLGGTAEAKKIATKLHQRGIPLIYSIAGLVRQPQMDCQVISGGFSRYGGLKLYCEQQGVTGILNVAHPYAQRISETASQVANISGLPYWRYLRPPWQASEGDDWQSFSDWDSLIPHLAIRRSVMLTAGQLASKYFDQLSVLAGSGQQQILRTAVKPEPSLPEHMVWLQGIGPFTAGDERDLMQRYKVDALVTKNSGGEATKAKLIAARELGVSVYLLARPTLPADAKTFSDLAVCEERIGNFFNR